jgi:hypothetical protein
MHCEICGQEDCCKAEIDRLRATLKEAVIELEDWGGYIDLHTKTVWGFDEMLEHFRRATTGETDDYRGPDYVDQVELLLEVLENLLNRVSYDMDAKNWFLDEQEAARKAIEKVRAT